MSSESSKKEWVAVREEKMDKFDELLSSIEGVSSKEKVLWREIYDNAISDRAYALLCFLDLKPQIVSGNLEAHVLAGKDLANYLTRMEKSNGQLLKLAEMISNAVGAEENLDVDDIFSQIKNSDSDGAH